jgi:hypothetical protein
MPGEAPATQLLVGGHRPFPVARTHVDTQQSACRTRARAGNVWRRPSPLKRKQSAALRLLVADELGWLVKLTAVDASPSNSSRSCFCLALAHSLGLLVSAIAAELVIGASCRFSRPPWPPRQGHGALALPELLSLGRPHLHLPQLVLHLLNPPPVVFSSELASTPLCSVAVPPSVPVHVARRPWTTLDCTASAHGCGQAWRRLHAASPPSVLPPRPEPVVGRSPPLLLCSVMKAGTRCCE